MDLDEEGENKVDFDAMSTVELNQHLNANNGLTDEFVSKLRAHCTSTSVRVLLLQCLLLLFSLTRSLAPCSPCR
jgi:hypothetical protein